MADDSSGGTPVTLEVAEGDILTFKADVAAFKYAQARYGADEAAAEALIRRGIRAADITPGQDQASLVETRGALASPWALFVGAPPARDFRYASVRQLGSATLGQLVNQPPDVEHVATTIHGPGFGLDEVEATLEQVTGFAEAILLGDVPRNLRRVTLVDRRAKRFDRIGETISKRGKEIPGGLELSGPGLRWTFGARRAGRDLAGGAAAILGDRAERKPDEQDRLFVALPFDDHHLDVFRYGIQNPAHAAGFLCEHFSEEAFVGEVVDRIRDRIETARAVIGVLTGANPNVFLEIGYAWGVRRPTILVSEDKPEPKSKSKEVPFDVRGQRHIRYKNIVDLEEKLKKELSSLRQQGLI
jgi:hypothetical protein